YGENEWSCSALHRKGGRPPHLALFSPTIRSCRTKRGFPSFRVTSLLMKSRFRVLPLRLAPLNYRVDLSSAHLRSNEGGGRSVFLVGRLCRAPVGSFAGRAICTPPALPPTGLVPSLPYL